MLGHLIFGGDMSVWINCSLDTWIQVGSLARVSRVDLSFLDEPSVLES
jgi:hypothetical protein